MIPNVRITNLFNLVHIMSFWGARGNSSQLHQLTGLRELMLDPQEQMLKNSTHSKQYMRRIVVNKIYHLLLLSLQRSYGYHCKSIRCWISYAKTI